jgi:alanyl-tRNA synthetase
VLDKTPFYAESGGQAGDQGKLASKNVEMVVNDCQKLQNHHLHQVSVELGTVKVGDSLNATVKKDERQNTARHHSATHLMHAALREKLGEHVQQRGSLVTFDKLRFDFSHLEAVTVDELKEIESRVNQQIIANTEVSTELMDIDSARNAGAMALFGEKYDDEVRVLSMGQDAFSKELCGGTHVGRTGDIGLFKIISESGIAAGVRRIEAVVGPYAFDHINAQNDVLNSLQSQFKCSADQLTSKTQQSLAQIKDLEKQIEALKNKMASAAAGDLATKAVEVGDVKVLAVRMDGIDAKSLRTTMDQMKNKLKTAVVVIAAVTEGKVQLAAGVTKDLIPGLKAGDLIKDIGAIMGARGGGKPDMAMAGGGDVDKIDDALDSVVAWVDAKQTA